MFGMSSGELIVIGLVALIVVGPKELPMMFRKLGEFTGKARRMAREFTSAMDAAADEAGVKDIAKDLHKVADPKKMGLDALKDATDMGSVSKMGPETAKLSEERAEAAEKIRKKSAEMAEERLAREAKAAAEAASEPAPEPAAKTSET